MVEDGCSAVVVVVEETCVELGGNVVVVSGVVVSCSLLLGTSLVLVDGT